MKDYELPADVTRAKLFVPISLGNHYYSLEVLQFVVTNFVAKAPSSIIFLCDRLRLLSYMIRGNVDPENARVKVQTQLRQMTRSLVKLGINAYPHASIVNSSFLQNDPRYLNLCHSLISAVEQNSNLRRQADRFANEQIQHFAGLAGPGLTHHRRLQHQYILEETALSLFMTEIRGFNVEVYRRGMGFVDYLYSNHCHDLLGILSKFQLDRKFVSLEQEFELHVDKQV